MDLSRHMKPWLNKSLCRKVLRIIISIKKLHKVVDRLKVEWWVLLNSSSRQLGECSRNLQDSELKLDRLNNPLNSDRWLEVVNNKRLASNLRPLVKTLRNQCLVVLKLQPLPLVHLQPLNHLANKVQCSVNSQDRQPIYSEDSSNKHHNLDNSSNNQLKGSLDNSHRLQHLEVQLLVSLKHKQHNHCLEASNKLQVRVCLELNQQLELQEDFSEIINQH